MKSLSIHITGKVYKVGFRYYAKQMAERCGICGSVRYSDQQTVIIEAMGNDDELNKFIGRCRIGCYGSAVKEITIAEKEFPVSTSFEIVNSWQSIVFCPQSSDEVKRKPRKEHDVINSQQQK
ncbi:MAG: acylphosphatase, partial [Bacteroidota bacterium]|nr:acylphosphatase [Bacteroidota bacterium]